MRWQRSRSPDSAFKGHDGEWHSAKTDFFLGQERQAKRLYHEVVDRIAAGKDLSLGSGPVTVASFAEKWIPDRRLVLADPKTEETRLRKYILPVIGAMRIEEVRPRHLVEVVKRLRLSGNLAPKTIINIYGVVRALFRDAQLADLIDHSPCILTKHQLGPNVDKDPEWRATAIFNRPELEILIADPRIPVDRQVVYALAGIAALRHGEIAGLRWRHYDPSAAPLGRLTIATSYDTGRTKTAVPRLMPVHPTLAAMLAEWRLSGWPAMMGRAPTPDDLVVPMPAPANRGPRVKQGAMRTEHNTYKRLIKDLATLGRRHRRFHDLRRTMITLARADGARKDILELCTHTPGKNGRTIDLYTSFRGNRSATRWPSSA